LGESLSVQEPKNPVKSRTTLPSWIPAS